MKRIGKNTLEFEMPPTILGHAAIGGKEAEGPLGADYDQTFQDTTLNTESWGKGRGAAAKESSGAGSGEIWIYGGADGCHLCRGFVEPVYFLHLRPAGFSDSFFGAVRSLLHYGANPAAFRRHGGKRSGGTCRGGYQLSFLLCGTPVQNAPGLWAQRTPTAQWTATASGCAIVGKDGQSKSAGGWPGRLWTWA